MYRKQPHLFMIDCSEYFDSEFPRPAWGNTREDTLFMEKRRNLQRMWEYAENNAIPVFSGDDEYICERFGMMHIDFPDSKPKYNTPEERAIAAREWIDYVLNSSPEFAESVSSLSSVDEVVVGGAHVFPTLIEKSRQLVAGGCIFRSVSLLDLIREYQTPGFTILVDPRITLEPVAASADKGNGQLLTRRKLYVVQGFEPKLKEWYLSESTSSAAHTQAQCP